MCVLVYGGRVCINVYEYACANMCVLLFVCVKVYVYLSVLSVCVKCVRVCAQVCLCKCICVSV